MAVLTEWIVTTLQNSDSICVSGRASQEQVVLQRPRRGEHPRELGAGYNRSLSWQDCAERA